MSQIKSSISLLSAILLLVATFSITSCGFRPVYATDDGSMVAEKLASVRIEPIAEHDGQVLQHKLEDILNPGTAAGANADYSIKINLHTQISQVGIQGDLRVTRYDVRKTAKYKLVSLADGHTVDAGDVSIKSSYNRTTSEFATFVANEDATEKASQELAQEIRSRLIYYFNK